MTIIDDLREPHRAPAPAVSALPPGPRERRSPKSTTPRPRRPVPGWAPPRRRLALVARWLRATARRRRAAHAVRQVLRAAPAPLTGVVTWSIVSAHNDVVIAHVQRSARADGVVKIARRPGGVSALDAHERAVNAARNDAMLAKPTAEGASSLIPAIEWSGTAAGYRCLVEQAVSGVTGEQLAADPDALATAMWTAVVAAASLHRATAHRRAVDADLLECWVHAPLRAIVAACGTVEVAQRASILADELTRTLTGQDVTVCRIHGDLALENLIYSRPDDDVDDDVVELAGLVDWEASVTEALPEIDLVHLAMSALIAVDGIELDDVVPELVSSGWRPTSETMDAPVASIPNVNIPARTLIVLAWLAHVSANLAKADRYATSGTWMHHNVDAVLAYLVEHPSIAEIDALRSINEGSVSERSNEGRSVKRRSTVRLAIVVAVVVQLWMWGVRDLDLNRMTDTGLVSLMRPPAYLALALLTISYMVTLFGRRPSGARLATHVVVLIGLLHATPAVVYGTLRYSWAWKHLSIVEYISRHHHVSPHIATLAAYHNWPGFFAFASLVTTLVGAHDARAIALWTPVAINLLTFCVLLFLYRTLTKDTKVVWIACWLFFVSNWIGQDYFAPQALAFVLYLVTVAVIIDRYVHRDGGQPAVHQAHSITAVIIVCTLAIVTSHQLTPVMLVAVLVALTVTRLATVGRFALFAVLANVLWYLTGARAFVGGEIGPTLRSVGAILGNAEGGLPSSAVESSGQAIVSTMGRMTVTALALVAVVGFVRRWRRGVRDLVPAVACVVPATLILVNDYGGEIVMRAYLFACPFLAYFAAHALTLRRRRASAGSSASSPSSPSTGNVRAPARSVLPIAVSLVLTSGFLFGYYGKDRQYHFSSDEVAATRFLVDHAPEHTLLVTATANYPNIYQGYERFTPVIINTEDIETRARVLSDPSAVLADWLGDTRYRGTYLLLTRSQAAEVDAVGVMPRGSVQRIEQAISASPRFDLVFGTADAKVFKLAGHP